MHWVPRPQVAMTLGRGIASRPWNAVGNFTHGDGAAEVIEHPAAAQVALPLLSRSKGQPAEQLTWPVVAAFQVDA
jgi:hypothetical protein